MSEITREHYVASVGHEPEQDDLERSNCPKAGEPMAHSFCGWDWNVDLPVFIAKALPSEQYVRRMREVQWKH